MILKNNPIYRTLDKLWQYVVKSKAGWRCEMCDSKRKGLQAAHIVGRRDLWLRWEPRNGIAACCDCHDDLKIKAWLLKNDPDRYQWCIEQRARLHQGSKIDMDNIEMILISQI